MADDISLEQAAGTIALISGKAWVRSGEITLPTPANEGTVSPNVSFHDLGGRELGPNDHVQPGDVVLTGDDSYLKIYFRDDSIMDVAPNTTFKVSQFVLGPSSRQISFTLLQGKVRTLVTRSLDPASYYRVATPASSMGVHGTEWVTNSYPQNGQYRTDVTVLEGKVVVDAPRPVSSGSSQTEQIAVTPGHTFSGVGNGGSVSKYSVFKLPADQIKELAAMVPNIETTRVGDLAAVARQQLPAAAMPAKANPNAAAQAPVVATLRGGGTAPAPAGGAANNANGPQIAAGGASPVTFRAPAAALPQTAGELPVAPQPATAGGANPGAAVAANAPAQPAATTVAAASASGPQPASAGVNRVAPASAIAPTIVTASRAPAAVTATSVLAAANAGGGGNSLQRPASAVTAASAPPVFHPLPAHIQPPPAVLAPPVAATALIRR